MSHYTKNKLFKKKKKMSEPMYSGDLIFDGLTIKSEPMSVDSLMPNQSASVPIPSRRATDFTDLRDAAFELNEVSPCSSSFQDHNLTGSSSLYSGASVWSPRSEVKMEDDDIFQVDKADLIQGPTLAELNANDETLLDDLSFDDLLLPEEHTCYIQVPSYPRAMSPLAQSGNQATPPLIQSETVSAIPFPADFYRETLSKTSEGPRSPSSHHSSTSSIPLQPLTPPPFVGGISPSQRHTTLHDLLLKNSLSPSPQLSRQYLAYADDIVLLGRTLRALEECYDQLENSAKAVGLSINTDKTKYMLCSRNDNRICNAPSVMLSGRAFENVQAFKYLGAIFTREMDVRKEIKERLAAGSRCTFALNKILKSRNVSRKHKINVYKTVIRPIVLYASETWILNESESNQLLVWERRVLRKIYGPNLINGSWKIKSNTELKELFASPDLVAEVRSKRLAWLGHLERMDEDRALKKIFRNWPEGRRKVGRPRKRWLEVVEGDLRRLGVRNWRRKATDRESWRQITKDVKALQGL
ncbi:repressed by TOR isoform X3 [Rhodnius prolixus]|uniref:repressed by TOR isoform X3 n=1 Tax=Rhodnius prolixus TaxID=13249 RepID=UPI003D18896D